MTGKQLKNSILQWAIQGKLVPQDPNDEPASVLLERIRAEKKRLVKEGKIKKDKNESIIFRGDDNSYYEKFPDGRVASIDDEIPFEVPQGWEWARINHIAISQLGKTLDRGKQEGRECPYLCSINVYWDGIDLSKVKTFLLKDEELSRYKLEKGDLLVCEGGDYGRCCVWDRDGEMYYQNALHRIRLFGNLDVYFYKYVFELYRSIGYIIGQGQTIKHFTYESMKGLLFPIPPLMEQKRVVEKIQEINSAVIHYGKSQNKLDDLNATIKTRLKKSILQEAIQGRLVSQDPADEPALVLLGYIREEKQKLLKEGKLKKKDILDSVIFKGEDNKYYENINGKLLDISDEIPFEIPDSWSWVRLQQVCSFVHRGKSPKYSDIQKYPVIAQKCNQWDGFHIEKAQFISPESVASYSEESILQDRDLLWNSTGIGTLGRIGLYPSNKNSFGFAVADSHITVIRAMKQFVRPEYLFFFFSSPTVQSVIEDKASGSTKQKELATETIKQYLCPIPPVEEQDRILVRVNSILVSTMKTR